MPQNVELLDFSARRNTGNNTNIIQDDSPWGAPEVVLDLEGEYYQRLAGRNGHYEWIYMSLEVAQRLHRALGLFLVKEAHGGA